jgi:streptogramin lyase
MKTKQVASLTLAFVSMSAAVSMNASAQTAPSYEDKYFATPTQGSNPWAIVKTSDGTFWFTEYGANNLGHLDPATGVIEEFPIPTAGGAPMGMVVGPDGNLWFTEQQGNNIGRYEISSGTFDEFAIPTASAYPFAITVGNDGNLWFTESSPVFTAKIGRITTAGDITEFSLANGNADPTGITAGPDGNLWFAEQFPFYCEGDPTPPPARIGTMNASGFITEFDLPACHYPLNITAAADGNLWFTEQVNGQIGRITTGGTISEFDIPNLGINATPSAILAGSDGTIWFGEATGNTIDIVTNDGVVTIAKQLTLQNAGVNSLVEGPNPNGSGTAIWFTATDNIGVIYNTAANGSTTSSSDDLFFGDFDPGND